VSSNNNQHKWKNEDMCEHIITLKDFEGATVAAAKALNDIQTRELYKEHYTSLKKFTEGELEWTEQRLYQLLDFHKIRESLPASTHPGLSNEKQARALKRVPEKDRAKVLKAAEKLGKITPRTITEAAKVIEVELIEVDHEGHQIPKSSMKTWNRRNEVDELLRHIANVRAWSEKVQKSTDKLYAVKEFSAQEIFAQSGNIYRMLKVLVPWSICPTCKGVTPSTCGDCNGRGMIHKDRWDRVDSVTKRMMKKKADEDASHSTRLSVASR
jgi:hypothetical protein